MLATLLKKFRATLVGLSTTGLVGYDQLVDQAITTEGMLITAAVGLLNAALAWLEKIRSKKTPA